jgi:hypothetical protein
MSKTQDLLSYIDDALMTGLRYMLFNDIVNEFVTSVSIF